MKSQTYIHNKEQCEHIGSRIGVLLSRGDYAAAFRSLAHAIDDELHGLPPIEEMSLTDVPGIDLRLANMIEARFDARYVRQLAGLHRGEYLAIPSVGGRMLDQFAEQLRGLGIPFPVPANFDFISHRWKDL